MRTVIIADSLIHDFASPLPEYLAVKANIGAGEIERVMGGGAHFGRGPLPRFLRAAWKARRAGAPIDIILVRDLHDPNDPLQQPELLRYADHALIGSEGAEFLPCLDDLVGDCHVIDTSTLSVPAEPFHRVMRAIVGKDLLALTPEERAEIVFVVTGFHAEIRVLSTAFKLRNDYGFPRVCVCPHLVGSRDRHAHVTALQVGFPNALVTVVPGLADMARMAGVAMEVPVGAGTDACRLEPADVAARLDVEQAAILQILFLTCSSVHLVPLGGGFSGSLLFLARGEMRGISQAPLVVKVSRHDEIQRELTGYGRVKGLLGTCVPTIGPPVSVGRHAGIVMTLASMQGSPRTFQLLFVDIASSAGLDGFLALLERALGTLCERLLVNTRNTRKYSPYQEFGLAARKQRAWLRENVGHILPEADLGARAWDVGGGLLVDNLLGKFEAATSRVDYLPGDVALCHGDLNFANLLTDDTGATWLIDWPYCDERPVEFDFAKLENDVKFVMTRGLEEADLPRLRLLEDFLLSRLALPEVGALPREVEFVAGDLRFEKMYRTVRLVREKYAGVKRDPLTVFYLVALLRYAVHTLSFDLRRQRGECTLPQLKYALLSVDALLDRLLAGPLHATGKRDRPEGYPERYPVPAACVSWDVPLAEYLPPEVGRCSSPHGTSEGYEPDDPTTVAGLGQRRSCSGALRFSAEGRPLHPSGRTGLAGRGFFWRWGPNPAVDPVITRVNSGTHELEFALVKREDTDQWGLPGGMVLADEDVLGAVRRIVLDKTGLAVEPEKATEMGCFLVDDPRNTDHAWVETTVFHFHLPRREKPRGLAAGAARVVDAEWLAVSPDFARDLFAGHARLVRAVVEHVLALGAIGCRREPLEEFLAST